MALVKCPDCGKMFSEHASECPECGCPVDSAERIAEEPVKEETNEVKDTVQESSEMSVSDIKHENGDNAKVQNITQENTNSIAQEKKFPNIIRIILIGVAAVLVVVLIISNVIEKSSKIDKELTKYIRYSEEQFLKETGFEKTEDGYYPPGKMNVCFEDLSDGDYSVTVAVSEVLDSGSSHSIYGISLGYDAESAISILESKGFTLSNEFYNESTYINESTGEKIDIVLDSNKVSGISLTSVNYTESDDYENSFDYSYDYSDEVNEVPDSKIKSRPYFDEFVAALRSYSDVGDATPEQIERENRQCYDEWERGEAFPEIYFGEDGHLHVMLFETDDEYLMPNTNWRELTEEDLKYLYKIYSSEGMTDDEIARKLTFARNEIYARHGYVFNSEELRNFFGMLDWYRPNPSVNTTDVSKLEERNAALIGKFQEEYGLTYHPL